MLEIGNMIESEEQWAALKIFPITNIHTYIQLQ